MICIPSKNRVEILKKNAWKWAQHLGDSVRIFVEPQDMDEYALNFPIEQLVNIGQNGKGLGFVKKFMRRWCIENGIELVFKCDDDLKGFSEKRQVLNPEKSAEYFNKKYYEFVKLFKERANLKAIALPYSFMMFKVDEEWDKVKKVQSSYFVRTEYLSHDSFEFSTFEDFSVGLMIVADGGVVLKNNFMGQLVGVPVGEGAGGCQDFNRENQAKIEIELLRKIYPPLAFKKVDKAWKVEPDMRSIKL